MLINSARGRGPGGKFVSTWEHTIEEKDFPPDSKYWMRKANASLQALLKLEGTALYDKWVDDRITDTSTWKDIRDMAEEEIKRFKKEQADVKDK